MDSKDYKNFTANDFVLDDAFFQWVRHPDAITDAFWNAFLEENPSKQKEVDEARRLIDALKIKPEDIPHERLQYIWQQIAGKLVKENISTGKQRRLFLRWVAAAVITAFVIAGSYLLFTRPDDQITIANGYGKIEKVYLPDSSLVILNAHSSISFSKGKAFLNERHIQLKGEAYFEVRHNPQAPFLVFVDNCKVEDIGTKFIVKYRGKDMTQVALISGAVAFTLPAKNHSTGEEIMMKPGDVYHYNGLDSVVKRLPLEAKDLMGWANNQLVFRNEKLKNVFSSIEELYGYHLVIEDKKLLQHSFTSVTPLNRSDLLIEKLKDLYNLNIIKHEDTLLIYNK